MKNFEKFWLFLDFNPCDSDGKASVYNAGDRFYPWVGKIPWRRKWQPTPVLLLRKSHGWRSLLQVTVHGVTKSRTRLSDFTFSDDTWVMKKLDFANDKLPYCQKNKKCLENTPETFILIFQVICTKKFT